MTPTLPTQDTQPAAPSQAEFQALLHAKMRLALRVTLIDLLEDEVTAFIGVSPYQRGSRRRDQRNGAYVRDWGTTVGLLEDLPVPRTRKGFRTQLFERYQRRQAQLDAALGDLFVFGASLARVGEVVETLTGLTPSPSTVSRVFHKLDAEFEAWKQRPLAEHYAYVFADGTYFTIIYDGEGAKTPILAVVGIRADGTREVLAFTVGERENQAAWADLFANLKRRGLKVIDLTITDGGPAMLNALAQHFPTTPRQRCVKHKIENVLGYIPEAQQATVEPELKAIFYTAHGHKLRFCVHAAVALRRRAAVQLPPRQGIQKAQSVTARSISGQPGRRRPRSCCFPPQVCSDLSRRHRMSGA